MAERFPSCTATDQAGLLRLQTVPTQESDMQHMVDNVSEQVVPELSHVHTTTPLQEVPEVENIEPEDMEFLQSVLTTLPGVDPSKALQDLEQMVQEMEEENEEEEGQEENPPHSQFVVPYSPYPLRFPPYLPCYTPPPSPPHTPPPG